MKNTSHDIARAFLEAAHEALEARGLGRESHQVMQDLRKELLREGSTAVLVTPSGDAGTFVKRLEKALEERFGHSVALTQKADPSLIGGAILEYSDMRVDRSIRGALEEARKHLETSTLN
jgi:hypothetical protein